MPGAFGTHPPLGEEYHEGGSVLLRLHGGGWVFPAVARTMHAVQLMLRGGDGTAWHNPSVAQLRGRTRLRLQGLHRCGRRHPAVARVDDKRKPLFLAAAGCKERGGEASAEQQQICAEILVHFISKLGQSYKFPT